MKTSVALCTYNGEHFLRTQIESILDQTVSIDEIVVCDDRSTDDTLKILNEYHEKHPGLFKIFVNEKNLKSVKNFEKAISLCSGDLIFLSDQDDKWRNDKVEKITDFLNANLNITVVATNGYAINDQDELIERYSLWDVPMFLREKNQKPDYFKMISNVSNIATGASMAIRKSYLGHILPFPAVEGLHHDEWIAMVSSYENKFEMLDDKLFYYREHSSQQVGGVFFKKTEDDKLFLIQFFDLSLEHQDFSSLKKLIKKFSVSHQKTKNLLSKVEDKQKFHFIEKNLPLIEKAYHEAKKRMAEKYPVRFFLLNLTDKILNKRQLTKNG
ncbi:glycosyltransferase [Chryseobacterium sp. GMJ5]|uniref:Glycosyltransferase n=1 Tax=Chryseobacterium gilvum TaxID=2976534 RepID=A0ABT2VZG6_9FLAO|nr:glycosyltransferase [Chryseobacterium gilvum]MCU7615382.1 glycosyltransferase [Chryseobacterium gilvum]